MSAPISCAGTCTRRTRSSIPRCASSRRRSWCASPTAPARDGCRRASPTRCRSTRRPSNLSGERRGDAAARAGAHRGAAGAPRRRRPRPTTAGWPRCTIRCLAPALAPAPREPERRWTVADLAAAAAVSRSVLDERFRQVLGRSPIRYLTEWRMHLAEELLATTDSGVAAVARRVGYDSEEAFSRAFSAPTGSRRATGGRRGRVRTRRTRSPQRACEEAPVALTRTRGRMPIAPAHVLRVHTGPSSSATTARSRSTPPVRGLRSPMRTVQVLRFTSSRSCCRSSGRRSSEPARCMMSPHTWQSTTSRSRACAVGGATAGRPAAPASHADGARSSGGRSSDGALGVVASSTPGSVGCSRSPTVRMPSASRLSIGRYSTASRRKM